MSASFPPRVGRVGEGMFDGPEVDWRGPRLCRWVLQQKVIVFAKVTYFLVKFLLNWEYNLDVYGLHRLDYQNIAILQYCRKHCNII